MSANNEIVVLKKDNNYYVFYNPSAHNYIEKPFHGAELFYDKDLAMIRAFELDKKHKTEYGVIYKDRDSEDYWTPQESIYDFLMRELKKSFKEGYSDGHDDGVQGILKSNKEQDKYFDGLYALHKTK